MTDLVDHSKVQSLLEKGTALSDVSHDSRFGNHYR